MRQRRRGNRQVEGDGREARCFGEGAPAAERTRPSPPQSPVRRSPSTRHRIHPRPQHTMQRPASGNRTHLVVPEEVAALRGAHHHAVDGRHLGRDRTPAALATRRPQLLHMWAGKGNRAGSRWGRHCGRWGGSTACRMQPTSHRSPPPHQHRHRPLRTRGSGSPSTSMSSTQSLRDSAPSTPMRIPAKSPKICAGRGQDWRRQGRWDGPAVAPGLGVQTRRQQALPAASRCSSQRQRRTLASPSSFCSSPKRFSKEALL